MVELIDDCRLMNVDFRIESRCRASVNIPDDGQSCASQITSQQSTIINQIRPLRIGSRILSLFQKPCKD
jgi:hypothetical protein